MLFMANILFGLCIAALAHRQLPRMWDERELHDCTAGPQVMAYHGTLQHA